MCVGHLLGFIFRDLLVLYYSYNLDARKLGALHIPATMRDILCAAYDCDVNQNPSEGSVQNSQKFKAPDLHGATTLEQGGASKKAERGARDLLILCCSNNLDAT